MTANAGERGVGITAQEELRARASVAKEQRQRRLDAVFGTVLPTTTSDEREPGHRDGFPLEHYRSSRPPHWGVKG